MRGLKTDDVISGPIRGLKININGRGQTYTQTYRHCDSMADLAQRAKSVETNREINCVSQSRVGSGDTQVNYKKFCILLALFPY